MKYLPFDIAIRLIHNVRYVKGRLIKHPLCIASLETWLQHLFGWIYYKVFRKNKPTPSGSHTPQTVVLITLSSIAHSSPPPNIFNILAYSQAHFMAFSKDFPTNTHKVLFLTEKLTCHYCDWFSSHSVRNPEVLQDYDQFVLSCLSLVKTRILMPHLLLASQAWSKVQFLLENTIRNFACFSLDYRLLTQRLAVSIR
ncbi:hypothetical protein DSO57_1021065 [Entomophthora muscae]|uniref:Uncharacterized protein n=1 Tax=Entomophthora muscae TaxID=34485 RepID=A0ACC2T3H1_9FUNG|nr:hypothetical protein DSO57_1021065 [Entomophthora muscae]